MTRYRASQLTPEQSSGWFRRLLNRMSRIRTPLTWGYTAAANANRDKEPETAQNREARPPGKSRGPRAGVMAPRRGPWPLGRGSCPQRKPGRKSDFGVLSEPSSGLSRRRIVNCVQPRSKLTILRSLKAKTHDYLRHRKAHARTTDKNVHFSLPRPRKTVCFDRQRPKTTVFRIAHLRVRIVALQGGGHGPPGRRGSRHRSGKTTQNWEAQRRSGERSPGARVAAPRARVVTPRATWISASRRENHPEL